MYVNKYVEACVCVCALYLSLFPCFLIAVFVRAEQVHNNIKRN